VQIHRDVGSRRSIAMHYGMFRLTDEGIGEPVERLARAREAAGLVPDAFRAIELGETVMI
jgi:N-acyl-phosphatidylethanolamine-hydrolysing phospholipase D